MAPGRIDDASTAAEARPENEINHEGQSESLLYKPRQRPYDPRPPVKVSRLPLTQYILNQRFYIYEY